MKRPLILTFDCGTQSTRALLVDKSGGILAKVQKYFEPYYSNRPAMLNKRLKLTGKLLARLHKSCMLNIQS